MWYRMTGVVGDNSPARPSSQHMHSCMFMKLSRFPLDMRYERSGGSTKPARPKRIHMDTFGEHTDGVDKGLPLELCDLLLNGADGQGRSFVHPTLRVLLKSVCAEWYSVIRSPSKQWVTGPLTRCWNALSGVHRHDVTLHDAFMTGRLATRLGLYRFMLADPPLQALCGGDPSNDSDNNSRGDGAREQTRVHESTLVYRARCFQQHVGCCVDRTNIVESSVLRLHEAQLLYVRWDDEMAVQRLTRPPCRWRANNYRVLLSMGRPLEAIHYARACASQPYTYISHAFPFDLAMRLAYLGFDDPLLIVRALNLGVLPCFNMIKSRWSDFSRDASQLWEALAVTGSVRCTRTLVDLLSPTPSAESTQMVLACLASAEIKSSFRTSRCVSDALCATITHKYPIPMVSNACIPWVYAALTGPDPCGVVCAHGAKMEHIRQAFALPWREGMESVYDRLVEIAHQRVAGWNIIEDPEIMPSMIAVASGCHVPDVMAWAIRRGCRLDVEKLLYAAAYPYGHELGHGVPHDVDLLRVIVETWPQQLVGQGSRIVEEALVRMIEDGRWDDADRAIGLTLHLFRSTIAAYDLGLSPLCDNETAQKEALDQTDKLWTRVEREKANVWRLDSNAEPTYPKAAPQRIAILAKLAARCDPVLNPATAAAWRFWFGVPAPIEASPCERAALVLSHYGLLA